jgi:hypothetical protein
MNRVPSSQDDMNIRTIKAVLIFLFMGFLQLSVWGNKLVKNVRSLVRELMAQSDKKIGPTSLRRAHASMIGAGRTGSCTAI